MRHKKQRTESNCLNCGHLIEERYCSVCGQENLAFTDSTFHLVLHYFQDLFHYNGKFWHTFKQFIRKPGLVAREYMAGKRQSHLNPIQFYVFSSTVFFIFLFFIADPSSAIQKTLSGDYKKRLYHLEQEREFLIGSQDTMYVDSLISGLQALSTDTSSESSLEWGWDEEWAIEDEESSWLLRKLKDRIIEKSDEMKLVHEGDGQRAINALLKEILHSVPQLIFLSLPFFALFLRMLYFRSERKTYVASFIFSVYQYSYLYIILLFYLLTNWLLNKVTWPLLDEVWGWLTFSFIIYLFVYLYLSMRRFYTDNGFSLIMRYLAMLFLCFWTLLVLFVVVSFLTYLI